MNTTAEDLAYTRWMDEQAGAAEFEEQRRYETWRDNRVADGEDGSEESYLEYLEGLMPTD